MDARTRQNRPGRLQIRTACSKRLRPNPQKTAADSGGVVLRRLEAVKVVLIGGNPKGFLKPFHESTLSGRRLRGLLSKVGLECELADMTQNETDVIDEKELERTIL